MLLAPLAIAAASCTGVDAPAIDLTNQSSIGDAGSTDAGAAAFSFDMGTTPLRILDGASTPIPVAITRSGSSPADVQITLKDAPSGVTTGGSLTIPSTESSGELTITIADSVSQGPISITLEGHAVNDGVLVSADVQLVVAGLPGTLDTSFAQGGRLTDLIGRMLNPIAALVSSDDHIYVPGSCPSSSDINILSTCIARLNPNGELDITYGNSGLATLDTLTPNDAVVLSDGRTVVGGTANNVDTYDGAAHDMGAYGTFDATGKNSKMTILSTAAAFVGTTTNSVSQTSLAPNDSVVMFFPAIATDGSGNDVNGIAKIKNTGTLDTTFGNGGFVNGDLADYHSGEADAVPLSVAGAGVYPNGNVVIMGGGFKAEGEDGAPPFDEYFGFLQLDSSGAHDASFGTNGQTAFEGPAVGGSAVWGFRQSPLTLLPDGRILWVKPGGANSGTAILAFTADGTSLDDTFGGGGFLDPHNTGVLAQAYVFLDDQSRLLVTSCTTPRVKQDLLSRYTSDGVLDPSFGEDGQVSTTSDGCPWSAHVQSDGRIVVVTDAGTVLRYWN
ncbi:MAG: hypothetical protein FWD73_14610 [Polyangiaceae bacterium]|nr:hypothetical protein [Polyangiaceae bacterium]